MSAATAIRTARPRRGGFVMIILLAFVALAGALIVLTAQSTSQLSSSIRRERESIALRQLLSSATAWVQVHGDRLREGEVLALDASTILDEQPSARVTIRLQTARGATRPIVEITASVIRNGQVISRAARVELASIP